MDKGISTQTCNTGGSSLSFGISCNAGMSSYDTYETPDEICLCDGKESIGENVTKQICNAGGSNLSHGSSCSAGFSEDSESEDEEANNGGVAACKCNSGK